MIIAIKFLQVEQHSHIYQYHIQLLEIHSKIFISFCPTLNHKDPHIEKRFRKDLDFKESYIVKKIPIFKWIATDSAKVSAWPPINVTHVKRQSSRPFQGYPQPMIEIQTEGCLYCRLGKNSFKFTYRLWVSLDTF